MRVVRVASLIFVGRAWGNVGEDTVVNHRKIFGGGNDQVANGSAVLSFHTESRKLLSARNRRLTRMTCDASQGHQCGDCDVGLWTGSRAHSTFMGAVFSNPGTTANGNNGAFNSKDICEFMGLQQGNGWVDYDGGNHHPSTRIFKDCCRERNDAYSTMGVWSLGACSANTNDCTSGRSLAGECLELNDFRGRQWCRVTYETTRQATDPLWGQVWCGCPPTTTTTTTTTTRTTTTATTAMTCVCYGGSPVTGPACTSNGANICSSCNAGFTHSRDQLPPNARDHNLTEDSCWQPLFYEVQALRTDVSELTAENAQQSEEINRLQTEEEVLQSEFRGNVAVDLIAAPHSHDRHAYVAMVGGVAFLMVTGWFALLARIHAVRDTVARETQMRQRLLSVS